MKSQTLYSADYRENARIVAVNEPLISNLRNEIQTLRNELSVLENYQSIYAGVDGPSGSMKAARKAQEERRARIPVVKSMIEELLPKLDKLVQATGRAHRAVSTTTLNSNPIGVPGVHAPFKRPRLRLHHDSPILRPAKNLRHYACS